VVPSGSLTTPGGAQGVQGPTAVSADAGNLATLGTDSLVSVQQNSLSVGYAQRYYRFTDCDAPLTAANPSAVSGAGASITPAVGVTSSHIGLWSLASGTVANAYAGVSSNSLADLNLTIVSKLTFRTVFQTPGTLFSGASGTTTYGQFYFGFMDTLNVYLGSAANYITWRFAPDISANWVLHFANAGVASQVISTVAVSGATWYDLSIYWDSSGVKARCGIWTGTPPALLSGGPFTTNLPAASTNLYWQILIRNGTAGTTNRSMSVDLIEVCGEATTLGGFRGDQLLRNF
jgi:hypothetical protein